MDTAWNASVILTLTDAGREPSYSRSLPVALMLARRTGAILLLVDRSEGTWAETPHHRGPFSPEDFRRAGRTHLDAQLGEAAAEGLVVRVRVPSFPLPESYYQETVSHNGVDLAVLPERYQHPTITERLSGTRTAQVAKAMVPTVPVVQVSRDGGAPAALTAGPGTVRASRQRCPRGRPPPPFGSD